MASSDLSAFDGGRFIRALDSARTARDVSWREIARVTGVSASTITRIRQGAKPDVDTFFGLCAWASLDPSEFQGDAPLADDAGESLTKIAAALRADPKLTAADAELLEAVLTSAYQQVIRTD
jgi:transcriptional regulator with XRE-family HTH domain